MHGVCSHSSVVCQQAKCGILTVLVAPWPHLNSRTLAVQTFGHMVSGALYEKRFGPYFAAPVIAGLEEDGTPYLCGMDTIGAMVRLMGVGARARKIPVASHLGHCQPLHVG